jgi:hypothetical protein
MGLGKGVQAEVLVKAQQEVGEVMGELGLAFIKVAKFEMEAGFTPVHATNAKCVATGAVKASRFYRECTAQCVQHLVRHLAPNFSKGIITPKEHNSFSIACVTSDLVSSFRP